MWREHNQGQTVENVCPEMELLLRSLFDSILEVKEEYLFWSIGGKIAEDNLLYVERAFAYELYFQWKMNETICHTPMYKKQDKFVINAEIRKDFVERVSENSNFCYPDMVLHGGNNSNDNYIICEIKRKATVNNDKNSLTKDINKLGLLITDNLHTKYADLTWKGYEYGVFILTDKYWGKGHFELKESDVINNLVVSDLDVREDLRSRIICVLYNGRTLRYNNLNDILKDNKS